MKSRAQLPISKPPEGEETGAGPRPLSRRLVLRGIGSALVAAPLIPLACAAEEAASADGAAGGSTGLDAATDAEATAWASGGTAAMRDKASYPNPFAAGVPTACVLTCEATLGPCYSAQSEVIRDISYGFGGLPTRVYLQVLNESCQPVAGAEVDVWHVSPGGKYSGNDPANEDVAFCTGNDADYTSHLYFRGRQTTDASGVLFFDTCYPGWYAGRTVHIHLTVRLANQAYLTTQLLFDDTLNDDILTTQPLYNTRGARTTTNQNDNVVATSAVSDYSFATQKMTDGALLAWKTLVVRSSLSSASCQIAGGSSGGGGPAGDGGPPGPRA